MNKISVLFVCMGNICRSPTAHGVFQMMVEREGLQERIAVDSAGTHAYHVGNPPDSRSQLTAQERGVDLSCQRARRASVEDFERFDYIVAMDLDNLANLRQLAPRGMQDKLYLLLDFAPELGRREVPDPYYGGARGFDDVFDLVSAACERLLEKLQKQLSS